MTLGTLQESKQQKKERTKCKQTKKQKTTTKTKSQKTTKSKNRLKLFRVDFFFLQQITVDGLQPWLNEQPVCVPEDPSPNHNLVFLIKIAFPYPGPSLLRVFYSEDGRKKRLVF
jgi:hypothetical protein